MSYADLIEDLVSSQEAILGAAAVAVAADVDGLSVDADGSVEAIDGDPVDVVDELVSAYVDRLGGAATSDLRSVAEDYDDLDLPSSLR